MAGKPNEDDPIITSQSDTSSPSSTETNRNDDPLQRKLCGEKAYDVVANYTEQELREFLNCVTASKKDLATNKTGSIAQILLERETQVLREESGSGDDSPDSSKHKQSRAKPRHSTTRHLQNRFTNPTSNRFHQSSTSSYPDSQHNTSGGSASSRGGGGSAAARNTAGSLGSLHDLSTDQGSGHSSGRGNQHSAHAGAGHSRRQHSTAAQSAGAGGGDGTGGDTGDGSVGGGHQRASTRARTGGSCGNLSRSSFDTQPPGARKRARRSREAAPASTSTKEGGSLQNLSKVEGCAGDDQKRLQKSGSLSQVFCDEAAAAAGPKVKGRRRKASSETQHHQRASEERSSIPADYTSSEEEEEDDDDLYQYQPLSPTSSPPPPSREDEATLLGTTTATTSASAATTAAGSGSSTHVPSGSTILPISATLPPSPSALSSTSTSSSDVEDELHRVEVDEQRRSAHITLASTIADTSKAKEVEEEGDGELIQVVTHIAHSDNAAPIWPVNEGVSQGQAPAEVDKSIGFFNTVAPSRLQEGAAFTRSHSIESDAFPSNAADGRGSERERLRTQHSEPSQLGKSKDRNGNPLSFPASCTTSSVSMLQQMTTSTITTSSTGAYCSGGGQHSSSRTPPIVAMTQLANSPLSVSAPSSSSNSITILPSSNLEGSGGSASASSLPKEAERKRANRASKKKKQAEVTTVDTSTPGYIGDKNIEQILELLGEAVDEQTGGDASSVKKKKKQPVANKREDKKDKRDDAVGGGKKTTPQDSGVASSKRDEECKDDHKKEDSGGGGAPPAAASEKKRNKKEEKKGNNKAEEAASNTKKELIEKEIKKNGFVSSSARSSISSGAVDSTGAVSDDGSSSKPTLAKDTVSSVKSTACDSKRSSVRTNVDSSSVDAATDNAQSRVNNKKSIVGSSDQDVYSESSSSAIVETIKVMSSVSNKKSEERKTSNSGAASSSSNGNVGTVAAASASATSGKRGKKGGKGGRTIRESSSVEDLVSKCKQSEQINVKKQTTMDDEEVSKKRPKDKVAPRKSSEAASNKIDNREVKEAVVKEKDTIPNTSNNKNRRAVDDIKVKSSSSSVNNKSSGNTISSTNNNNSNKKLSRRLSSSNSNVSTSATESSEFGRDFYKVGDIYGAASGSNEMVASQSSDIFKLVSRKKNRNRRATLQPSSYSGGGAATHSLPGTTVGSGSNASGSAASSGTTGGAKSRWGDEYAVRDGYREYTSPSNSTSNFSSNSSNNFNASLNAPSFGPKNSSRHNSNNTTNSNSNNNKQSSSSVGTGKRKPPINFDEAPRTPHDGNFMAHLSAAANSNTGGGGGGSNTATSAPNTDCSDSDGDDSVHSMPTSSSTPRPDVRRPASSSDTTPQASYANIARLAGTANKNQVKRLTSAPVSGRPSTTGSAHHSAAACATSDQSLLTTNAWPRMSSGGSSATTTAAAAASNFAATSAAASAPAIPNVVGRTASSGLSSSSSAGGARSSMQPSVAAVVAASSSAVSAQGALQPTAQNFLQDNFPPLKSTVSTSVAAATGVSGAGAGSSGRQASLEADTSAGLLDPPVSRQKDTFVSGSVRTQSYSEGSKRASVDRSSKTPDKESSPLVDSSSDPCSSVVTSSVSIASMKKASSRSITASSFVKENTPEPKTSASFKEQRQSPRVSASSNKNTSLDSINGHATVSSPRALPTADGGKTVQVPQTNRILQQVSNVDNKKVIQSKPSRESVKKQRSLELNSQGDPTPISSTNSNRISNANLSKSADVKRKQNDPVVFADPLRLTNISNSSNLTFMFGSNEDLTNALDLTGPNVTVNNIVNSTNNALSSTSTNSSNVTNLVADANGNPLTGPCQTPITTTTTSSSNSSITLPHRKTSISSIVPSSDLHNPGALHSDNINNLNACSTVSSSDFSPGDVQQPSLSRGEARSSVDVHRGDSSSSVVLGAGSESVCAGLELTGDLEPVTLGDGEAGVRTRVFFRRHSTVNNWSKNYSEVALFMQANWDNVNKRMTETPGLVEMYSADKL